MNSKLKQIPFNIGEEYKIPYFYFIFVSIGVSEIEKILKNSNFVRKSFEFFFILRKKKLKKRFFTKKGDFFKKLKIHPIKKTHFSFF